MSFARGFVRGFARAASRSGPLTQPGRAVYLRYALAAVLAVAGVLAAPSILLACGDDIKTVGTEIYFPLAYGDYPTNAQLMVLGRKIFSDASLSASGKQSCASCHSPSHAYGPPNALAVQLGGPDMKRMGFRNTPSLTYVHSPVAFTEHFIEPEVNGSMDDEGPTGGRTWDGRVNTGHEQALMPLLDPNEMANASTGEVLERLRKSAYAEEFRQSFSAPGENVFDNPDAAIGWLTVALEMFEKSPADFHSFSSKYDAYLRDEARLSAQERRGLAVFNDPKKGNCASCHFSDLKTSTRLFPLFTDYGYSALGVPRNRTLPANADEKFHDLGLCGPLRKDMAEHPEYCGMFRTPTLRNVALRKNFFHNGAIHKLRDAVEFYVTRETNPEKWYPRGADGKAAKYDDLPQQYVKNIHNDVPFKPLPGNLPRLSASEIDDVVAFLGTLTDGYQVKPASKAALQAAR